MSHHTHYHPESQTWFTLDTCENCGGDIQAANAVQLVSPNARTIKYLGLTIVDTLPVEGYYSEETQGEQCENCIDDHDITITMSPDVARAIAAATITHHGMSQDMAKGIIAVKRELRRKLREAGEGTDEVHYTQEGVQS